IDARIVAGGIKGGNALKITSPFVADAGMGMSVAVKPNTRYRLGGMIRTEGFQNQGGRGVMLNVHGLATTNGIHGTRDWAAVSCEFNSENQSEILVHCLIGGFGGGTGTAWFDELFLHETARSGDTGANIAAVVQHFITSGPADARAALASALASRTDENSRALLASLRTGPVVTAEIVRVRKYPPDPATRARGLAVYNRTCIACHGPDGKGVPGAFPPLDGTDWVTGDPSVPARIILGGLQGPIEVSGQKYENVMPPHTDLNDTETADVITYIRQSWSNDASGVSADSIKQIRAKHANRNQPWTAAELK
ncbi:MAG: cytochrome c, partial [Akkermansiaceae bacterium]